MYQESHKKPVVAIRTNGARYALAEIDRPESGNFLQLETICKDKNFGRVVHVLYPNPSKLLFKLGRGHDADVKIGDISVSRVHAQISLTPKGYMLEDGTSKFGTLFLLPTDPYEVDPANGLSVQIGRSMITFSLKQKDSNALKLNLNAAATGNLEEGKAVSPAESANVYSSWEIITFRIEIEIRTLTAIM